MSNSDLYWACVGGDVNTVKELLKNSNVNPGFNDNECLVASIKKNKIDVANLLLDDPRVNPWGEDGSALIASIQKGNLDLVQKILTYSYRNKDIDKRFSYFLEISILERNLEIFSVLLSDPRSNPGEYKNTTLRRAIGSGIPEIVRMLLADKRVNPADDNGSSMYMAWRSNREILQMLLDDGRAEADSLQYILNRSIHEGKMDIINLLLSHENSVKNISIESAFEIALHYGNIEIAKLFINDGSLTINDELSNKWLILAIRGGVLDMVKFVIEDLNANPAFNHNEPLRTAAEGNADIVIYLLELPGVDPTDNNNAALTVACKFMRYGIVDILISDPRVQINDNEHPVIEYAASNGRLDVLKRLIGGETKFRSFDVYSVLREAAMNNQCETVQFLLTQTSVDPAKYSLDLLKDVASRGYTNVLRLLINDGRIPVREHGNQLLIWAIQKSCYNLVYLLLDLPEVDPSFDNDEPLKIAITTMKNKIAKLLLIKGRVNPARNPSNHFLVLVSTSGPGMDDVLKLILRDKRVKVTESDSAMITERITSTHDEYIHILIDDGRIDFSYNNNQAIKSLVENDKLNSLAILRDKRVDPTVNDNALLLNASESPNSVRLLVQSGRMNLIAHDNKLIRDCFRRGTRDINLITNILLKPDVWTTTRFTVDNPDPLYSIGFNEHLKIVQWFMRMRYFDLLDLYFKYVGVTDFSDISERFVTVSLAQFREYRRDKIEKFKNAISQVSSLVITHMRMGFPLEQTFQIIFHQSGFDNLLYWPVDISGQRKTRDELLREKFNYCFEMVSDILAQRDNDVERPNVRRRLY